MKLILVFIFCLATLLADVQKEIQAKLILAQKGDIITLPKGKIDFNRMLVADGIEDVIIKGFGIEVFLSKSESILDKCDINILVTNKNSQIKTLYIEVKTFGRNDKDLGVVNFILSDLSIGDKIEQKSQIPKAKFCNAVQRIEIFGG